MARARWATAAAVLATAGVAWATPGSPGTYDTTFGGTGLVTFPGDASGIGVGEAMAVGADSSVVFVGTRAGPQVDGRNTSKWTILKRLADGSVDAGFGTGGEVSLFGSWGTDRAHDVVVDGSGRIVLAGNSAIRVATNGRKGTTYTYPGRLTVARLLADGSLDSSFGSGGVFQVDVGGYGAAAHSVAIQADGKIVVSGYLSGANTAKKKAGTSIHYSDNNVTVVLRLTSAGALDGTFGTGGVVTHDVRLADDGDERPWMGGTEIQSDGSIVVGAHSPNLPVGGGRGPGTIITRYTSSGAIDTAFGTVLYASNPIRGLDLDASDRILVTGQDDVDGAVILRFTASGALDTGFGTNGKALLGFVGASRGACVQADGKIVAACFTNASGVHAAAFPARVNDDGSLDLSYGTNGLGDVFAISGEDVFNVFAGPGLTPAGRLVIAGGYSLATPGYGWWIARYDAE
jgi:uncharacterized delta-60 repeat protein